MMIVIAPQRLHYNMLIRKNTKGWRRRKRVAKGGCNNKKKKKKPTDKRYKNYGRCLCLAPWELEPKRGVAKERKKNRYLPSASCFGEGRAKAKRPGRPIPTYQQWGDDGLLLRPSKALPFPKSPLPFIRWLSSRDLSTETASSAAANHQRRQFGETQGKKKENKQVEKKKVI